MITNIDFISKTMCFNICYRIYIIINSIFFNNLIFQINNSFKLFIEVVSSFIIKFNCKSMNLFDFFHGRNFYLKFSFSWIICYIICINSLISKNNNSFQIFFLENKIIDTPFLKIFTLTCGPILFEYFSSLF